MKMFVTKSVMKAWRVDVVDGTLGLTTAPAASTAEGSDEGAVEGGGGTGGFDD